MPVRLEPAAPRSRVKHSTTEPLRSQQYVGSDLYPNCLALWLDSWKYIFENLTLFLLFTTIAVCSLISLCTLVIKHYRHRSDCSLSVCIHDKSSHNFISGFKADVICRQIISKKKNIGKMRVNFEKKNQQTTKKHEKFPRTQRINKDLFNTISLHT